MEPSKSLYAKLYHWYHLNMLTVMRLKPDISILDITTNWVSLPHFLYDIFPFSLLYSKEPHNWKITRFRDSSNFSNVREKTRDFIS